MEKKFSIEFTEENQMVHVSRDIDGFSSLELIGLLDYEKSRLIKAMLDGETTDEPFTGPGLSIVKN